VRLQDLCPARGVPALKIGTTDDVGATDDAGPALDIAGVGALPLSELRHVVDTTLPLRFA
jgi:phosphoribosylformylglycinamidine synthase